MRCVIVDDNHAFLEAARTLLERQGLTVAGVASNAADGLRQAETLRPDVVLVDIALGEESGIEVARRLVESNRGDRAAVLLISTSAHDDVAELIAGSAAAGFLSKEQLSADAIRRILDGRRG